MKDYELETVIALALEAQEAGASIATILQQYPAHVAELQPVLEMAALIINQQPQAGPGAERASRERLLQAAATRRQVGAAPARRSWVLRLTQVLAPLALLLLISAGVLAASQRALPGDAFYGLKLGLESVGIPGSAVEDRRQDEVRALIDRGREEAVDFVAVLDRMETERWIVGGIPVSVNVNTEIVGTPNPGSEIRVWGRTAGNQVVASRIEVRGAMPATPAPATAEATATPPATASPTASPTLQSSPTVALTPTLAPTPTPQPTPLPTATATIDDDDDGNENGDDADANENGSDGGDGDDNDDNDNDNDDNDNDDNDDDDDNDNDDEDDDNDNGEDEEDEDNSGSGSGGGGDGNENEGDDD